MGQCFGWQCGKRGRPAQASRFHLVVLLTFLGTLLFALSGVDPVKVTEYSIVLSAAALPLTYFPKLYLGAHLLDRQLLDRDGRRCGEVDDVELEAR